MTEEVPEECTIRYAGMTCEDRACTKCGWYRPEAERRRWQVRSGGMRTNEKGISRLVIMRPETGETEGRSRP